MVNNLIDWSTEISMHHITESVICGHHTYVQNLVHTSYAANITTQQHQTILFQHFLYFRIHKLRIFPQKLFKITDHQVLAKKTCTCVRVKYFKVAQNYCCVASH